MFTLESLTKSYLTPSGRKYIFRNLNLVVPPNKNIGLIGRNGAGKSTLMRLLGGADVPDSGRIVSDKSVSWPVGLSGGFQGTLSGKDNVKFVCRVHGITGEKMRDRVEFVDDFAEIGGWFNEPVKTYSSGMRSRLAFGLSMAFNFDYYLIDEVMSVGDAKFKEKCANIFNERIKDSNIILVTHSMNEIKRFCDVVLFVQGGGVHIYNDVSAGILAYQGK